MVQLFIHTLRCVAAAQTNCTQPSPTNCADNPLPDQEIPWPDQPLVYYQKYRFYFQEYDPTKHIISMPREGWGIAAAGGHAEYDVPQCPVVFL